MSRFHSFRALELKSVVISILYFFAFLFFSNRSNSYTHTKIRKLIFLPLDVTHRVISYSISSYSAPILIFQKFFAILEVGVLPLSNITSTFRSKMGKSTRKLVDSTLFEHSNYFFFAFRFFFKSQQLLHILANQQTIFSLTRCRSYSNFLF